MAGTTLYPTVSVVDAQYELDKARALVSYYSASRSCHVVETEANLVAVRRASLVARSAGISEATLIGVASLAYSSARGGE